LYVVRFSYHVNPANRQRAIDFIRREAEGAKGNGLSARLLVPLTRGQGGAALQFEVELTSLGQLDQLRHHAIEPPNETGSWMRQFSEILVSPPEVEILRLEGAPVLSDKGRETITEDPSAKDRDEPGPGDREKLAGDEREHFESDAMRERDA
jgi:hypothetical protein